jgi:LPS export ABC transporter permease LptG/LPS export ABC transporter permease LptF
MNLLSRAVFREIGAGALLGTALFTSVLFMQKLSTGKLFESLLRGAASPGTAAYLLLLLLPPVLIVALPVGTLVGVLIGLGRMSSDGEIVAMRAAGVPGRRVTLPIFLYGLLAMGVAGACSLYLTPWSWREWYRILNQSVTQELTAMIQPRVFEEQFTGNNMILYVRDVKPTASTLAEWKQVFMADTSPPAERTKAGREPGDFPRITIAAEAVAVPDAAGYSIQLAMKNAHTYEVDKELKQHTTFAPISEQRLQANPKEEASARPWEVMDTTPLAQAARTNTDARIELHRRFAMPLACLVLAMLGIPLGVSTRKSGKSGAFVITVAVAFLYNMGVVSLIGMAKQGRLQAEVAAWTPNLVFGLLGLVLLAGVERPGDRDPLSRFRNAWHTATSALQSALTRDRLGTRMRSLPRIPLLPGVIDTYVLASFLFYFAVSLATFVMLAHVYTFFELLSEIFTRGIPMWKVIRYHIYLTPHLLYTSTPMAVLVAVLVSLGILSKNNEVTAMKACGVSLYRLSMPIVTAAMVLSGALFAFDHYYIPECNRIQDGIRDEIKGRPPQTYLRPDRKWIYGEGSRIFFYKYFDPVQNVMIGPNVYELDPVGFRLVRHVFAERARWEPGVRTWVFQNGWSRELKGVESKDYRQFQATSFPEITETPQHFLREVKQEKQLNFFELEQYIEGLRQSGLDTVRLQVQFHKKFSVPLFGAVIALLAVPFAFVTGSRGAMAGVGVSFGIAIAYFALGRLFEEIGNVNQLPAAMAAWAPVVVFMLAGMYMFGRMRT